jgi:hypothetical protein
LEERQGHAPRLPDRRAGPRRSTRRAPQGWRNLFVDDISDVTLAARVTTWQSADNYDASQPFNAIDRFSVAIA